MRKRMLLDHYGRIYDEDHLDESTEGKHCRALLRNGELISTARIDIDVQDAAFRLINSLGFAINIKGVE